jgi:hypothetical protein
MKNTTSQTSKDEVQLRDHTTTARAILPDARRIRGLLKSPHTTPLTVEEMDDQIAKYIREERRKPRRQGKHSR